TGQRPDDLAPSRATAPKITMILFGQRTHGDPFIAHTHVDFRPGPIQHVEHPVPADCNIDGVIKSSAPQPIKANSMAVAIGIVGAHLPPSLSRGKVMRADIPASRRSVAGCP